MIISYEMWEVSHHDHQSLLTVPSMCHMAGTYYVTSPSHLILTQPCDDDDDDGNDDDDDDDI